MSSSTAADEWQNNVNNLKTGVQTLYEKKQFADVTFTVGTKKFEAHKLILASRCTEFSRLLMDPNSIKDHTVEEKFITETGFEILLRFIYTDTLGTDDKQSIVQAFLAADHYKQKKLRETCDALMQTWRMTVDEVCELLNVSLTIDTLKEKCLNFIKTNGYEVISSPTFFKLNYEAMVFLLDSNAFNEVERRDCVERIIDWGARQKDNTQNYALVREYFKTSKPPLLPKLKIEELKLPELSELFTTKYTGILTPTEITNFMHYTHEKKKEVLPEWCTAP